MFPDQLVSAAGGASEASCRRNLSRRTFLAAGAAVGGGLLLSVSLPTPIRDAKATDVQIEPVSLKARAGTTSFGLLAARAAVLERAPYVLSKLTAEIAGRAIARLSVSPPTLASSRRCSRRCIDTASHSRREESSWSRRGENEESSSI